MKGNVFVIGLGLIGGSIALTIKKEHPEARVTGYDAKLEEMKMAKALMVVDDYVETIQDGVRGADLIILATPVLVTEKLIGQLGQMELKENVIITDTGSTKASIMAKAQRLAGNNTVFIGGHPMAGSHKSGVTAASLSLFENAFYLLTPFHEQDQRTEELKQWLKGTKANFITVSPEMHDEMVAVISHFPHVIAASLVHLVKDADAEYPLLKRLAAGGFRDITRIASSNPQMWADISSGNRENLIRLLDRWVENLQEVKKALADNKYELLHRFYAEAKQYRDCLPISGSGAIPSFYDLFVDIPDIPGVVSEITNKLAEKGISITNIRILEAREDIYGVLRISFRSENDRDLAMNLLKKETPHEVYIQ